MSRLKLTIKTILTALLPYIFHIIIVMIAAIYFSGQVAIQTAQKNLGNNEIMTIVDEKLINTTSVLMIISSLCLIGVFFFHHKNKKSATVTYRFNTINDNHILLVLLLGVLGFLFSVSFASIFNIASLDPEMVEVLDTLVMGNTLLITILGVGIITPICEEIVFRGSIMKNLTENMSYKKAIILQAVLFSLIHRNLVQAFPTLVLGLLTGLAVYYTNSIWSGIIIHIINNTLAVLISRFVPATVIVSLDVFVVVMVIVLIAIIIVIRKLSVRRAEWVLLKDKDSESVFVTELI